MADESLKVVGALEYKHGTRVTGVPCSTCAGQNPDSDVQILMMLDFLLPFAVLYRVGLLLPLQLRPPSNAN